MRLEIQRMNILRKAQDQAYDYRLGQLIEYEYINTYSIIKTEEKKRKRKRKGKGKGKRKRRRFWILYTRKRAGWN